MRVLACNVVDGGGNIVSTTVVTERAARVLFLLVEVARQNFPGMAEQRAAVTAAYCALAGKIRPSVEDRKLITRELAR